MNEGDEGLRAADEAGRIEVRRADQELAPHDLRRGGWAVRILLPELGEGDRGLVDGHADEVVWAAVRESLGNALGSRQIKSCICEPKLERRLPDLGSRILGWEGDRNRLAETKTSLSRKSQLPRIK